MIGRRKRLVLLVMLVLLTQPLFAKATLNGSTQWFDVQTAVTLTYPFTMCAWYKNDSTEQTETLISLAKKAENDNFYRLGIGTSPAILQPLNLQVQSDTAGPTTVAAGTQIDDEWNLGCVVISDHNDKTARHNDENESSITSSITPLGLDITAIGRREG